MSKFKIQTKPEREIIRRGDTIETNVPSVSKRDPSPGRMINRMPNSKKKKRNTKRRKNPDVNADRKCREALLHELHKAKSVGHLLRCLNVHDDEFEVLEFYGDSVLKETVSKFLLETRRFMDPHMMTQLRMMCIKNDTLEIVYDVLSMESLIPEEYLGKLRNRKSKGDIVEAVIGELIENGRESLSKKLIAFVAYIGEEEYFVKMATSRRDRRVPLNMREEDFKQIAEDITLSNVTISTSDKNESVLFFSPIGPSVSCRNLPIPSSQSKSYLIKTTQNRFPRLQNHPTNWHDYSNLQ